MSAPPLHSRLAPISQSSVPSWTRSAGLTAGGIVAIVLATGGLLLGRIDLALLALPLVVGLAWTWERRPAMGAISVATLTLGDSSDSEIDFALAFDVPDGNRGRGRAKHSARRRRAGGRPRRTGRAATSRGAYLSFTPDPKSWFDLSTGSWAPTRDRQARPRNRWSRLASFRRRAHPSRRSRCPFDCEASPARTSPHEPATVATFATSIPSRWGIGCAGSTGRPRRVAHRILATSTYVERRRSRTRQCSLCSTVAMTWASRSPSGVPTWRPPRERAHWTLLAKRRVPWPAPTSRRVIVLAFRTSRVVLGWWPTREDTDTCANFCVRLR